MLRDLVALSMIPTERVGREPAAAAARLADALLGLLHLDFVFVRLCVPGVAGGVDVTRGEAWKTFPEWLESHLARSGRLSAKEIIRDVGGGGEPHRGVVIPIGVNAEAGVVAVGCDRIDFPTEIDQLLLSIAANHAATAFQSARLIHERTRAEEELRKIRNELEVKVTARTVELRRSEAYLSEAQRLTHTGTAALNISTGELTHSSDEHSRLYGFDPEQGVPSLEEFRQRVHPEDRAKFTETLETGIREAANFEMEFRIVPPRSPQKHIRAIAHPVFTASGELEEFVGTVVDVTERKRAEEEHQAQLWFFESMDAINRAMQGTSHLEQMMSDVLDVVLAIFGCDRASLIYRCDSEVPSHRVRMERTRPEYIGAFGLGVEILNDAEVASAFRRVLASGSPVRFDPESKRALPSAPADKFNIKSMIAMAVFPKVDKPYIFALNQCSHARVWTPQEEKLFQEIGRRLADALDTLLMFRNLREAQRMVEASRDELRVLADEQAALRRVAMLVARGVPPDDVFTAVAEEVGRLVSIDSTAMLRYEADGTAAMIAGWTDAAVDLPVGARFPAEGENVTALVLRTERPALIEDYANATGELAARMRQTGIRSAAGAPIVVDGRLWGVIVAGSIQPEPLPAGAELRIAAFTELLGTAVANADSRAELTASRARIVTAADETRRRIERDLHDGVQQRLVSLGLELRTVQGAMPPDDQFRAQLTHTVSGLAGALEDLVEISRGIHPAILSRGGLAPALQTLARRSAVPVNLEVPAGTRLPAPVEVAAYYVVSEALTNTAKHAHASAVHVAVEARDGVLELSIRDDGSGGADPTRGSGLIGLTDRVHALGGTFEVASPVGHGTTLLVTLPIAEG